MMQTTDGAAEESRDALPAPAPDRLRVLARIAEYERLGYFDRDVEDDPPTRPLEPGEVDYTYRRLRSRIAARIANRSAVRYFEGCLKRGDFMLDGVTGQEHFSALRDRGALLVCNHFNPFDNYAVYRAIRPQLGRRPLYKIIREGNYTSFPGLFGYFFRHCHTLPLGSKLAVIREMTAATDTLLRRGEKVLIYPEQGMWWNYKKPRPVKVGAFRFAAKAGVPTLPIFITLREDRRIGSDGFPVLGYTVHLLDPIFPDPAKSVRDNAAAMARQTYDSWRRVYEKTYGIPLTYTTEGTVSPCSI